MYERKKVVLYIIIVIMLIMIVTGITYAFIVLNKSDNSTINGSYASVDISLRVEKIVGSSKLLPMDDSDLSQAINSKNKCATIMGYDGCHIYQIRVTNNGNTKIPVTSSIQFQLNDIANLKWQEIESSSSIGNITSTDAINGYTATSASTSSLTWRNKDIIDINNNNYRDYYIVVWISNLDENQGDVDKGSYEGSITFETAAGEVTSTFK